MRSRSRNFGKVRVAGGDILLDGDVSIGDGVVSGEQPVLSLSGFRAADAKRTLTIQIGADAAESMSFGGLENYWFNGPTTEPCYININSATSAYPAGFRLMEAGTTRWYIQNVAGSGDALTLSQQANAAVITLGQNKSASFSGSIVIENQGNALKVSNLSIEEWFSGRLGFTKNITGSGAFEFFTLDGATAPKNSKLAVYGMALAGSITNSESGAFGFATEGVDRYQLYTAAAGSGTVRPLEIFTGANASQLYLHTSGNVSIGTAINPTGTATKVLAFGDNAGNPTMGTDQAAVYNNAGTIYFIDENENITTGSPHESEYPESLSVSSEYPSVRKDSNECLDIWNEVDTYGTARYIALGKMAELVQELAHNSGILPPEENIVIYEKIAGRTWEAKESHLADLRDQEIAEAEAIISELEMDVLELTCTTIPTAEVAVEVAERNAVITDEVLSDLMSEDPVDAEAIRTAKEMCGEVKAELASKREILEGHRGAKTAKQNALYDTVVPSSYVRRDVPSWMSPNATIQAQPDI